MRILLHTCCAPCLISPHKSLSEHELTCFFYNPNIHPLPEFKERHKWVDKYCSQNGLDLLSYEYNPTTYLDKVTFDLEERCQKCYELRLFETARVADMQGFDAFTTTLLSSPYQKHELIQEIASKAARQYNIAFYYEDYRPMYKESVYLSKEMGMYRQKYCGCIYSLDENPKLANLYLDERKSLEL
ncbi:MAG: hypothetical protein C4562_02875 [Actinobacteria bacterium]|nr:MAG: hypothetical protein C4562_02875 [Actinomycetota bacterium]